MNKCAKKKASTYQNDFCKVEFWFDLRCNQILILKLHADDRDIYWIILQLQVTAIDEGIPALSDQTVVTVNVIIDDTLRFVQLQPYVAQISENHLVDSEVVTVSATPTVSLWCSVNLILKRHPQTIIILYWRLNDERLFMYTL